MGDGRKEVGTDGPLGSSFVTFPASLDSTVAGIPEPLAAKSKAGPSGEVHSRRILQSCLHMPSATLNMSLLREKANRLTADDRREKGGVFTPWGPGRQEEKNLPAVLTNK